MKAYAWYNFIFALVLVSLGTLFGLLLSLFAWSPEEQAEANLVLLLVLAIIPHIILSKKVIKRLSDPVKPLMTRGIKGLAWYTIAYVLAIITILLLSLSPDFGLLYYLAYQFGDIRDYIVLFLVVAILVFTLLLFALKVLLIRPKNMLSKVR